MNTEQLIDKIHKHERSLTGNEKDYWLNITFSLKAIKYCIESFSKTSDSIAVLYAKIIIMELWNFRCFLIALKKSITEFDKAFPDLKDLRDSYAHITERIARKVKPFNSPAKPLVWEKRSIANGALISRDGKNWGTASDIKMLFNFKFDGNHGAMSIFGLVNNFLVCNSETKLIEFEISSKIMEKLIDIVDNACV